MTSPTARSLALLRQEGYRAAVVEKWNPHSRTRSDLFGVVDVLAIRGAETLAVQATSGSNGAARVKKIAESDALPDMRAAGWAVEVWSWRKDSKGRWQCRRVDVS